MPNRLHQQTSPYLLQHADNPVDWQPWDEQALAEAVRLQRPILLSIGYSACHWCHVMEHESFSDPDIARLMNDHFVCIKVDREERPDLDHIYQLAHQLLTDRPGGWPLTVALTPERHAPFFAGTYFPPAPRMGLAGFAQVLTEVAGHYDKHRERMPRHAQSFAEALSRLNPVPGDLEPPGAEDCLALACQTASRQFDAEQGGFGDAPKFPRVPQLRLLAHPQAPQAARKMVDFTLRRIVHSGLVDQLGGGFFRYCVDREWQIPHFEKMLYDNAQLIELYSDAHRRSPDPDYERVARAAADWALAEMHLASGGFAATLDADSEGGEGAYYLWSDDELEALLSKAELEALRQEHAMQGEPNCEGRWHLTRPWPSAKPARAKALAAAHKKLLRVRAKRPRPGRDDKILTAWNGLMIEALARAGQAFAVPGYLDGADRAINCLREHNWHDGRLAACGRGELDPLPAYLDDYAFLLQGLIALLQARWSSAHLEFAQALADQLLVHFEDREQGGFHFTAHDHEALLYRAKSGADNAIPNGNGCAARALWMLGQLLGETRYLEAARTTLALFAKALHQSPDMHASLALARVACDEGCVILRGDPETTADWQRQIPPQVPCYAIPADAADLPPALATKPAQGEATAYYCQGEVCQAPVDDLSALLKLLKG